MGIFNFNDPKSNTGPAMPTQINLPDNILSALNLTKADIEAHHTQIIEKESTQAGTNYYSQNAKNIEEAPPIKLGEIALDPKTHDKSELVSSLYSQLAEMEGAMEQELIPDSLKIIKAHLAAFANGYSQAAMAARDWQTVIKTANITVEGGITNAGEIITKLAGIFKEEKEVRIKIAELIQELVNKNGQAPASTPPLSPAQPTPQPPQPEPEIIPTPIANLKPQNPNDTPLTIPKLNLAQTVVPAPITTPDGIILRPVPNQNPSTLSS